MAIAAGAVHVAQVGVHTDEDPLFGLFFVVVAALQLGGGAYLARPVGPPIVVRSMFVVGVVGSLATIGVWAISRTIGLPFGAEPGEAEEVGLADAAANIFELFTALLLFLWLRQERMSERSWIRWSVGGAVAAAGLAIAWIALRAFEVLDPDPRLVLEPGFVDVAAVTFLAVAAGLFAQLALWRVRLSTLGSAFALLTLVLIEASLVVVTVPARGGQNLDCIYAPIAEDSGISHARPPGPIEMELGQRRSVVVLLLVACASAPVDLADVVPLQPRGAGVRIESVSVDRTRASRVDRVLERPGRSSVAVQGIRLLPGAGRYPVTIEVVAVGEGRMDLPAFRVDFVYRGTPSRFGFASFVSFCVGRATCEGTP
jgi:hypothetical protein